MRIRSILSVLCAALLLSAGCARPAAPASGSTPDVPPTSNPAGGDRQNGGSDPSSNGEPKNIHIDDVKIDNPIVVAGRARTFENNVALRARDAEGDLIVETFTTSAGEMGNFNPYRAELWVTRDPGPRVIVEALEYSAKDGSERSLVTVERAFNVEPIEATLYFPDENCTRVEPYVRKIPKSVAMARLLVEALIAGPTEDEQRRGAVEVFPSRSRVESVNLRDGVLTVDFSDRLRNVGGACRAQMIRASVTETLRRLPTVEKVVITAGGSEAEALQP